jgi:hypothetical protein
MEERNKDCFKDEEKDAEKELGPPDEIPGYAYEYWEAKLLHIGAHFKLQY